MRIFSEFVLEIQDDGVLRASLRHYDGSPGSVVVDRLSTEKFLRDIINNGRVALKEKNPVDLKTFGEALYKTLFPGEIGKLFEQAVKSVMHARFCSKNVRLRLIVEVSPASEVFWWPLELVYYDDGKARGWLSTESLPILLSRRTQAIDTQVPGPEKLPLRVLLVMSNPLDGVMTCDILDAILGAGAAPGVPQEAGNVEVHMLFDRELAAEELDRARGVVYAGRPEFGVIDELYGGEWMPHVLHFIGHGKFEEVTKKGWLALVRGTEVDWCPAADLIDVLGRLRLRVVVLQACERAASGTEPAFMSLVDDLVRADIPAVVATQISLTSKSAIDFAKGFYEALIEGGDVDEAVQRGRRGIFRDARGKSPHFGTPVLFTYNPAGIIRAVPPPGGRPGRGAGPQPGERLSISSTDRVAFYIRQAMDLASKKKITRETAEMFRQRISDGLEDSGIKILFEQGIEFYMVGDFELSEQLLKDALAEAIKQRQARPAPAPPLRPPAWDVGLT
ncbi:MAG: CHAT domain-containing protein [Anaerolineae bacterium]|nr:CHAT domain-containing protein [Anaerolineae bacterium]